MSAATLRVFEPEGTHAGSSRENFERWADEILEEAFRAIAGLPGATPNEAERWNERANQARDRRLGLTAHQAAEPLGQALECIAKGYIQACATPGLDPEDLAEFRKRRDRAKRQALRARELG